MSKSKTTDIVREIFQCIEEEELPSGELSFQLIHDESKRRKTNKSPPNIEYAVGFYVVFQNKEAVPHKLIENFLIKPPLAKLSWRCSGPIPKQELVQRYCYPFVTDEADINEYCKIRAATLFTRKNANENGKMKEDLTYRVLHVYDRELIGSKTNPPRLHQGDASPPPGNQREAPSLSGMADSNARNESSQSVSQNGGDQLVGNDQSSNATNLAYNPFVAPQSESLSYDDAVKLMRLPQPPSPPRSTEGGDDQSSNATIPTYSPSVVDTLTCTPSVVPTEIEIDPMFRPPAEQSRRGVENFRAILLNAENNFEQTLQQAGPADDFQRGDEMQKEWLRRMADDPMGNRRKDTD